MDRGKRIKEIRKALEMTQAEFAEWIGVSSQALVSDWERGQRVPSAQTLELAEMKFKKAQKTKEPSMTINDLIISAAAGETIEDDVLRSKARSLLGFSGTALYQYDNTEELLEAYRGLLKRVDGLLPTKEEGEAIAAGLEKELADSDVPNGALFRVEYTGGAWGGLTLWADNAAWSIGDTFDVEAARKSMMKIAQTGQAQYRVTPDESTGSTGGSWWAEEG